MSKLLAAAGLYWVVHCDLIVAFSRPMSPGVTLATERDEIQLGIFARLAAKFLMVNLQVRHGAAELAAPGVAVQDLLTESFVRRRVQPQARWFWANRVHEAFSLRPSRNACR